MPPPLDLASLKQEEEARYLVAAIVDSSDDAILSETLDGVITSWNRAAERIFGYTAAEAVGRHISLIIPEDRRAEETEVLTRLRRGERIDHFETERVAKDGRKITISLTVSPVKNAQGQIVGASKVARDITHLRQTENALRESEDRFRTLADSSAAMIWVTDIAGRVEFANRAYLEFFNVEYERIADFNWRSILHPDDAADHAAAFSTAIAELRPLHARVRVRRADGQWRWIESRGSPRLDASGRAIGFAGSSSDITEIYESKEALKEADRKKNEFLATLAHELRNPLAPARNSLQIMRMARHDPEIMERALGTMERQIAHMVRLIDDLVDVSRISRGIIELRRERVDLAAVLHNAVEASRPLIDQAGHSFSMKFPAEPVFVDGDAVRLAQVFSNLLNNAAKYTGKGGRIHLTVMRRGADVIVRVEDNGVGIPPAMLSQVFEMFAQVDRSLDRYSGGLGIGLSIVKRLVEMHGGTVEARSEGAGRGTEVVVRLPIAMAPGDSRRLPEPKPESAEPIRRRILIAEDNEDTASSLATILRIMGNEVRTVGNGLEAVAKGRSFEPDVVLLDIGMPKLNGYEACRLIRAESWGSAAIIIALTGWGQEEDRQLAAQVGFDHYLVKPVETAALAKLLGAGRTAAQDR